MALPPRHCPVSSFEFQKLFAHSRIRTFAHFPPCHLFVTYLSYCLFLPLGLILET
jgi:hypothetical protein